MDTEDLRAELDALQAQITSLTVLAGALIQTHPNHTALQLQLTNLLEQQLGNGTAGQLLTEKQKEQVRDAVEQFGAIQPARSLPAQSLVTLPRTRRP